MDIPIGVGGLPDYITLVKGRRDEALGQDYTGVVSTKLSWLSPSQAAIPTARARISPGILIRFFLLRPELSRRFCADPKLIAPRDNSPPRNSI